MADDEVAFAGVAGVKDEIDIAGEITSHGTGAVVTPASGDAEVVRRLRAAGAIVVGKTKMPELGLWPFTESVTWGVTRNPWDAERTPGGSSGGSAAAVAVGMVPAAIGADGAGEGDAEATAHRRLDWRPQRLEPRTRALARPGALVSDRMVERLLAAEGALVARIAAMFDDYDAVLAPVMSEPAVPAGIMEGRGATATFLWQSGWVPFTVL